MKSTISSRGQITIPVKVQRALGMGPGTPVEFVIQPGGVLLRKRQDRQAAIHRYYGILKGLPPVDQLIEDMRGPVPPEIRRRKERSR